MIDVVLYLNIYYSLHWFVCKYVYFFFVFFFLVTLLLVRMISGCDTGVVEFSAGRLDYCSAKKICRCLLMLIKYYRW